MSEEIIVFFDRDCVLCQGSVKWLNRMDGQDRLNFAPITGETARKWGICEDEDSMALVRGGQIYRASEAARLAFAEAGGAGCLVAGILKLIPLKIREWGYRWIAQRRRALVKTKNCEIPEEGMREKLLD